MVAQPDGTLCDESGKTYSYLFWEGNADATYDFSKGFVVKGSETPEPDSMLRVFMAYKELEEPIEIEKPAIAPFERKGFTVVEWGGTEVK